MKTKCQKMLSLMAACVLSILAKAQTIDWNLLTTVGEENGTISSAVDGRYEFTSERYILDGPVSNFKFVFKDNYSPNGAIGNDRNGFPWVSISEFYIYDGNGNAVELTESCFATNAQEPYEGPMVNICDGDKNTFWHSVWSSGASDYHYLEITLPEGKSLSKFSFGWATRWTTQGNPQTVEVYCPVPMSADAQLVALNDARTAALAYVETLETLGLTKMKESLEQAYEETNTIDETSAEVIAAEKLRLENLVATAQAGIEAYNELGTLIAECDSLVAQQASVDFSMAINATKAVYENKATALAESLVEAHSSLVSARNIYRIEGISTSSFNFSSNVTVGDWYIALDKTNNVARVNRYDGTGEEVVVPETFTYNGVEYITVGLGGYSSNIWQYNYNNGYYHLKSVTLPVTLRFLGSSAFYYCKGLEEIGIPSRVERIDQYAFEYCVSLNNIKLPNSVTVIGNNAFSGCSALENMTIPANVATIGTNPFSNCPKLRTLCSEAVTPPSCSNDFNTNIRVVYVPEGSGAAYEAATYWKNRIIVDGEGLSASVDVETPGALGEMLLDQVEYLRQVNYLTISGTLNDDDIYNIQNRMTGLLGIDMSKVNMTALPNNMFDYRYALQQVVLPENLESIGQYAFRDCYNLQDMVLPVTLKSIGSYAFEDCDNFKHVVIPEGVTSVGTYAFWYCDALHTVQWPSTATTISNSVFEESGIETIVIPEGVTTIAYNTFRNCDNLQELVCPSTIVSIGGQAFSDCDALRTVVLNEGLTHLYAEAFGRCQNLTDIVLPSTLGGVSRTFYECNGIKTIACNALVPPFLENGYDILYRGNKENCVLYVPEWTINKYKLTAGWDVFSTIKPIKGGLPENIRITDAVELTLPDSVSADYKPNLTLDLLNFEYDRTYGTLILNGNKSLSVGKFHMAYDPSYAYDRDGAVCYNSLISNVPMRADSVGITSYHRNDVWTFISFPYDVRVSDIVPLYENTNYVIRKYSGKDRADANFSNTWQDMTVDSILRAGEGYIWQSSRNTANWCGFEIPAINNTNKNLIFANDNRTVTLSEYVSEFSHNRSWNLIGNPYPCYYDTRAMDFTAPITVWDSYSYYAYSPVDDEYILRPGEAFFVQRPVDAESITFAVDGRQTDRTVRERSAQAKAYTRSATTRQVFNLTLSDGEMTDRTRFVINPDAAQDYDMSSDATKFMSSDARAAQLYTVEGDVQFAINERPMGNGVVTLGTYFGSQGSYTIALDTKVEGMSVVLVDKVAGTETDLTNGNYTFTAEAGSVENRFEVRMKGSDVTGVESQNGQPSVKAINGQIIVVAPRESAITVYNAEGRRMATATATSATFDVEQGVYMVKVQDTVHKVSVVR